jgi:hypothetical protein
VDLYTAGMHPHCALIAAYRKHQLRDAFRRWKPGSDVDHGNDAFSTLQASAVLCIPQVEAGELRVPWRRRPQVLVHGDRRGVWPALWHRRHRGRWSTPGDAGAVLHVSARAGQWLGVQSARAGCWDPRPAPCAADALPHGSCSCTTANRKCLHPWCTTLFFEVPQRCAARSKCRRPCLQEERRAPGVRLPQCRGHGAGPHHRPAQVPDAVLTLSSCNETTPVRTCTGHAGCHTYDRKGGV